METKQQVNYNSNLHVHVLELTEFEPRKRWLPTDEFKKTNMQKRAWLDAIFENFKLSYTARGLLEKVAFLTDSDGIGSPSIGTIAEKTNLHYNTVRNHLKKLKDKGIIDMYAGSRENLPRHHKPTNKIELIGFKYKLEDCSSRNVNNNNLYKYKTNTYIETEAEAKPQATDVCPSSQPKPEPRPRSFSSGHISEQRLRSDDDEEVKEEIERAAIQHDVEPELALTEFKAIRSDKVLSKGGYLRSFFDKVKSGNWNHKIKREGNFDMRLNEKQLAEQEEIRAYARSKEAETKYLLDLQAEQEKKRTPMPEHLKRMKQLLAAGQEADLRNIN